MRNLAGNKRQPESKKQYSKTPACPQHRSLPRRTCFSPQSVHWGNSSPRPPAPCGLVNGRSALSRDEGKLPKVWCNQVAEQENRVISSMQSRNQIARCWNILATPSISANRQFGLPRITVKNRI